MPHAQTRIFLGVLAKVDSASSEGAVHLSPKEANITDISIEAADRLQAGVLTPAQASKLRGKAGWASSNLFARLGRVGLSALKDRQYWTEVKSFGIKHGSHLEKALMFLRDVLPQVGPRSVPLWTRPVQPTVIYSDAAWPSDWDGSKEIKIPRIGWVIFTPGCRPKAFSMTVNRSITGHLLERRQQIMAMEAFAAIAAPTVSPELFQDKEIIWFVDNESAVSSLIRGASRPEDVNHVAAVSTVTFAKLNSKVWFEWIDTESNPADGLSRQGVSDPWTAEQPWDCVDLGDRDWSAVFDTDIISSPSFSH